MAKYISYLLLLVGVLFLSFGLLLAQTNGEDGIISEITGVTIGEDAIPIVTFTLSDPGGSPLSLEDVESVRFLFVRIDEDELTGLPRYFSYFINEVEGAEYDLNGVIQQPTMATAPQATFESGEGEFAEVEPGVYTYTFAQPLNDDFNDRRTHVIGAEVIKGPRSVATNPIYAFEPDGD